MLGVHQDTYDSLFRHPMSRSLQWRDLKAMLASLTEMNEVPGGDVQFARNGQVLTVRPPVRRGFTDVAALMDIRRFLERSEAPA